ncbi:MAG: recombinase family protein [Chloroflexi bacterium]|nr:recombinase family protein [Chloroflexota bacterium]
MPGQSAASIASAILAEVGPPMEPAAGARPVYGYLRKSLVLPGTAPVSLAMQENAIRDYAQRHGLYVSRWWAEVESAAGERAVYDAMLASLDGGAGVLFYDTTRLGRTQSQLHAVFEEFQLLGKLFVPVNDPDLSDPLLRGIYFALAAKERERLQQRTRDAMLARFRRGEWLGMAPLGLRRTDDGGLAHGNEADLARYHWLVAEVADRGRSASQLARQLTTEGVAPPGRPRAANRGVWLDATVADILRSPAYQGWTAYQPMRWGLVGGRRRKLPLEPEALAAIAADVPGCLVVGHRLLAPSARITPVLTPQRWALLQARLDAHRASPAQVAEREHDGGSPLIGLVRCGGCGRRLSYYRKGRVGYASHMHFRCALGQQAASHAAWQRSGGVQGCANNASLRADVVEEIVLAALGRWLGLAEGEAAAAFAQRLAAVDADEQARLVAQRQRLAAGISQTEAEVKALRRAAALAAQREVDGEALAEDEAPAYLEGLLAEAREALADQREALATLPEPVSATVVSGEVAAAYRLLLDDWECLSGPDQRVELAAMGLDVRWDGPAREVTVRWNPLWEALLGWARWRLPRGRWPSAGATQEPIGTSRRSAWPRRC